MQRIDRHRQSVHSDSRADPRSNLSSDLVQARRADVDCTLVVDGDAHGELTAGSVKKLDLEHGMHIIEATSSYSKQGYIQELRVKSDGQQTHMIELKPLDDYMRTSAAKGECLVTSTAIRYDDADKLGDALSSGTRVRPAAAKARAQHNTRPSGPFFYLAKFSVSGQQSFLRLTTVTCPAP